MSKTREHHKSHDHERAFTSYKSGRFVNYGALPPRPFRKTVLFDNALSGHGADWSSSAPDLNAAGGHGDDWGV